jgi:NADPH-dependent 2,4-dienoyl-CoA reductase/sulfur reductase-like enzyme/rhodanese-related sulfurtransferase
VPAVSRRLVVVGGVAGGMSAAARARRLDETLDIVVLEAGPHVSYAGCGLPYHLSGRIERPEQLVLHTPASLAAQLNLDVRTGHEVVAIDRASRTVTVRHDGTSEQIGYDALLLAPGAVPVRPPIPGVDDERVHVLRTVPDAESLKARVDALLAEKERPAAVVVGAGFIGLETVEALVERGLDVHLVELADHVLPPLEPELAALVDAELRAHGVQVHTGTGVTSLGATVTLGDGTQLAADVVVLGVGVRPSTGLARDAGLDLAPSGAIVVDADQRTSDPAIWAVGDAVQVRRHGLADPGVVPLAGPANRQGRRAADSICGHRTTPQAAVLGTAIVRVFGLTAAMTGPNRTTLAREGVEHEVVRVHTGHHVGWYPGAEQVHVVASFAPDGALLGAQAVGRAGVDRRIDVLATALRAGMTADDLAELELAYAPPYGAAKDVVNMLGFVAQNALDGSCPQWQPEDLPTALADELVLDVRSAGEFAAGHLPGALLVPHTQVRGRLDEIAQAAAGRPIAVHCGSGVRSHLATRILRQNGLDARNQSGGWLTLTAFWGADPGAAALRGAGAVAAAGTAGR